MIPAARNLPRLYESADDAGFDAEEGEEDTLPQMISSGSGIRSFFDRLIVELERKGQTMIPITTAEEENEDTLVRRRRR